MQGQPCIGLLWYDSPRNNGDPNGYLKRIAQRVTSLAREHQRLTFGSFVANRALVEMAIKYFQQPLRIYASDQLAVAAEGDVDRLRRWRSPEAGQCAVSRLNWLPSDWTAGSIDAWFDSGGDALRPLRVRAAARSRPFPIISITYGFSLAGFLHEIFLFLLLAQTYPFDAIVCTSRAAKVAFEKTLEHVAENINRSHGIRLRYNGRLPLIPLGVDTDSFYPTDKARARSHFAIPRDKCVVLYFGRLSTSDKGDMLPWLAALRRLPATVRKRVVVLIAGGERPGMAKRLRDYAHAVRRDLQIKVISPFPESMKPVLYSAADIFISPADCIMETFGLTALEAMSCGVPQIVSDWDGYRDIVRDGETGFLIPTVWARCDEHINITSALEAEDWEPTHFRLAQSVAVDCDAFAERIKLLLENGELRNQFSQASRRRAVTFYNWPEIARQYDELLTSATEEARNALQTEWPAARAPGSYCVPHYFEVFKHYASRSLGDASTVRLSNKTPHGSEWARALAHPLANGLDISLLDRITELVSVIRSEARTVDKIISACTAAPSPVPSDLVWRHVMWLIKYGFLSAPDDKQGEAHPDPWG